MVSTEKWDISVHSSAMPKLTELLSSKKFAQREQSTFLCYSFASFEECHWRKWLI